MTANFYRAFEDRHRGSRESIQSRQEEYLPFLDLIAGTDKPVLDLGCGRGEWLELLRDRGFRARGVDLDAGMLQACRQAGLDVAEGDALGYLATLPDASQGAVTSFHVVEHLPMDVLHALIREALRVLVPGGLLILETPNPENLVVGTAGFYTDPTHVRPLPPALLSFMPEYYGFSRVKVLRLHEPESVTSGAALQLVDVLANVSPDYAVIARKAGGETSAVLEAAFERKGGASLHELARRHGDQLAQQLNHATQAAEAARGAARVAEVSAASAERRAMNAEQRAAQWELRAAAAGDLRASAIKELQASIDQSLQAAAAQAHRKQEEIAGMQHELLAARLRIEDLMRSRSWRITRPLRWLTEQSSALREQGLAERLRRLLRRLKPTRD